MRSFVQSQIFLGAVVSLVALLPSVRARAQDITDQGGELSTSLPGHNAIQVAAPNVSDPDRYQTQINGFEVFHRRNSRSDGLGPRFINASCGGCHVQNGKGPLRLSAVPDIGSTMVIKVSVPGIAADGGPRNVPGVGDQLQDHTTSRVGRHGIRLRWRYSQGRYADGTRYELRSPRLTFSIPGQNMSRVRSSLRMSPLLIGLGLIEAIPESTILAFADPNDLDGDGISGKAQYSFNIESQQLELGRFGFRGSSPTLAQQSGGAAFKDMGLTNEYFPGPGGSQELDDEEFNRLVVYQAIAGVPKARNQEDGEVQAGKALFQQIKCDSCHRMTVATGASVENPEVASQTIHPFTDVLLHDMGPGLADKRPEFSATGREWRTTPLWGLGFAKTVSNVRQTYLHDGRARTVAEAILWHDGEGRASRNAFKQLSKPQRRALLAFLNSL